MVTKLGTRIINGTVVTNRTEFAYQVSFRVKSLNHHFCAGTIISERAVLTAAHCFETYSANSVVAVVGDLDISATSRETVHMEVAAILSHADYNRTSIENDVAVAMTKEIFSWTSTVNFLPLANNTPQGGTECYISGWGSTYYEGPASPKLLYAIVLIINKTVCNSVYGNKITEDMLCAGYLNGTADACSGDSGGPLVCGGVVAGIVSWGYGCAHAPYPGVYTDVAYFKSWIETQIENYTPDSSHSAKHYFHVHIALFLIVCVMLANK
ncbi:trypsin alpha-3 isoform X2 [Agrilus planipennis]|nr:trypsin alpha-3 isoform X2 [Agrilus planipennis]